ncbi:MAG: CPXCG motif-containing cysteine-rich protein [Pseudomonadota bacterium]|nr:CPXCG motif-containing cysteine-rich protein [Pseudomonadota bacterium]
MEQIEEWIDCPYCGQNYLTLVDPSAGSAQYIEDCMVCCQPIVFHLQVGMDDQIISLVTRRDDD